MALFSKKELDFLFDCIDAKEHADKEGSFFGSFFGAMLCRTDDERAAMKAAEEEEKQKREAKTRVSRERCILLKAKLIRIRDGVEIDDFLASTSE